MAELLGLALARNARRSRPGPEYRVRLGRPAARENVCQCCTRLACPTSPSLNTRTQLLRLLVGVAHATASSGRHGHVWLDDLLTTPVLGRDTRGYFHICIHASADVEHSFTRERRHEGCGANAPPLGKTHERGSRQLSVMNLPASRLRPRETAAAVGHCFVSEKVSEI